LKEGVIMETFGRSESGFILLKNYSIFTGVQSLQTLAQSLETLDSL